MSLSLTPFYAAPLVLLYIALSARVIAFRRANRIPLGDAGNSALLSRIRAQGNCAEYMPLGVILLLMAELSAAPPFGFHLAALCLVVGRIVHAVHLSYMSNRYMMRVIAIVLTFTSYLVALILALL